MCAEEGGGTLELMAGGKDIEVTSSNVYDYVRKYAKYRMIKAQAKAMEVCKATIILFFYNFFLPASRVCVPEYSTYYLKDH